MTRTDTCSMHIFKHRKRTRIAGFQLIITKNFRIRAQIDHIDYSANPDGLCKCSLCCGDHNTKLANCKPLTRKYLIAAACVLLSMFRVTGLPDMLQSDNADEFLNITRKSKTTCFTLEQISIVITCCD